MSFSAATMHPLRASVLVFVFALGAGMACAPAGEDADAVEEEEVARPVPVEVRTITTRDMEETILANTTLVPETQVSVVSDLPGTARDISVDEGDTASAGMVLLRITQEDVRFAIADARLALQQATEQVDNLRPLLDDGLISRQAFDEVRYQQDRAELALDRARAQSRDTTVSSPITGVVTRRHIEVGEAVVPGQPLFEIATLDHLEAVVAVPERDLAVLRLSQRATLTVNALDDAVVPGHVSWIDPVVDPQAGTVRVRIALEPPPSGLVLRPGMFVTVNIVTAVHRAVPVLPKRALIYESDDAFVFVVRAPVPSSQPAEDDEVSDEPVAPERDAFAVERVRVELGFEAGSEVEVLEGVDAGDRVIVVGHDGLSEDATVFLTEPTTP